VIPTSEGVSDVSQAASHALEAVAVLVIVAALVIASGRAAKWVVKNDSAYAYSCFKETFGRGLLLGLEILVAADLLWTVAVEQTWENLAALGVLVLIRTLLSWSLEAELEGYWPWQRRKIEAAEKIAEECTDPES
jgi:uncharacterized membrane protein